MTRTSTPCSFAAAKADKTFDQTTFYGYDDADRINEHEVTDDSGRLARVAYTYDDTPVEFRVSWVNTEHHEYLSDLWKSDSAGAK